MLKNVAYCHGQLIFGLVLCCQRITLITRIYLFLPTDSTNITDSCFATSVKSVKSVDFIFLPTDSTNITYFCLCCCRWVTLILRTFIFVFFVSSVGKIFYSFAVSSVFSMSFIRSFSLTLKCRSVLSATIFCITLAQAAPLQVLSFSSMLTNCTPQ